MKNFSPFPQDLSAKYRTAGARYFSTPLGDLINAARRGTPSLVCFFVCAPSMGAFARTVSERILMPTAAPITRHASNLATGNSSASLPSRELAFGEAFDSGMRTLLHNWARGTSSYECARSPGSALVTVTIRFASDEDQQAFRFTLRPCSHGGVEQTFLVITHPRTAIERSDSPDRRLFPVFRQPRDLWTADDLKLFIESHAV
jgi:hypothetical protein